jgi:hypothetical protein
MWLTLAGVILSIFLLGFAIYQTRVMVLTAQYQSAITVIDQSTQVTDGLFKQDGLGDVLNSTTLDRAAIEKANESLEAYQSLIFKAALLKEKGLLPDDFWNAFALDFCSLYNNYPFIRAWWARQKDRRPYADLSQQYRNLGYSCHS